jgi:hypothetical protein
MDFHIRTLKVLQSGDQRDARGVYQIAVMIKNVNVSSQCETLLSSNNAQ